MTPEQTIKRIAEVAADTACGADVGASELAGQIVSILARHPEKIDDFMKDGFWALSDANLSGAEHGCLTFYRQDGKVTTPSHLHAAREVQKIKRALAKP